MSFRPSGNICLTLLSAWDGNIKLQYCIQTYIDIINVIVYVQTNLHTLEIKRHHEWGGEIGFCDMMMTMVVVMAHIQIVQQSARGRDTHKDNTFLSLFYDNKNWVLLFFLMCTFYILLFTSFSSFIDSTFSLPYYSFLRVNYKWNDIKLAIYVCPNYTASNINKWASIKKYVWRRWKLLHQQVVIHFWGRLSRFLYDF